MTRRPPAGGGGGRRGARGGRPPEVSSGGRAAGRARPPAGRTAAPGTTKAGPTKTPAFAPASAPPGASRPAGQRRGERTEPPAGASGRTPAKSAARTTTGPVARTAARAAAPKTVEAGRGVAGQGSGATAAFPSVMYLGSLDSARGLPADAPEFALIGRSNVGKSSLLNALCGSRKLARTSRTPGRTQRIHIFDVEDANGVRLRLCDLPGYGHAAAGAAVSRGLGVMIESFLTERPTLRAVLLLWDIRRDPDPDTLGFLLWLREHRLDVRVVATKIDKLARTRRGARLEQLRQAMELRHPLIATSSSEGDGVEGLRAHLVDLARVRRPLRELPAGGEPQDDDG